jgi:hypothetical protein
MAEKMEGGIITVEELRVLLKDANIDTVRKYINIYGVLTVQIALLQNAMMEKLALPNIKGYPPQVFISYRWENEAHKLWVLKLARFLERSGFHVHFDQNDLDAKAGLQEVPAFVSSIAAAQYALVINSPGYIDRVTARKNQTSWCMTSIKISSAW